MKFLKMYYHLAAFIFHPDAETRKLVRTEYDIEDKIVIGHVGRFTFAKNQKLLIEAFAEYHKEHLSSVLMIVGDGELHGEIENQVDAFDISKNCLVGGKSAHTERFYQAMDVMVMPSLFEGLGIAAVEAQACKVPAVLSETIFKEAVISDRCIFLSLEVGADKWAEKIEEAFGKSITYTKAYADYNIKDAANFLTEWYCER